MPRTHAHVIDDANPRRDSRLDGYEDIQCATAALDGVLNLIEQQSMRSEECYSAYCLLESVRDRFREGMRKIMSPN